MDGKLLLPIWDNSKGDCNFGREACSMGSRSRERSDSAGKEGQSDGRFTIEDRVGFLTRAGGCACRLGAGLGSSDVARYACKYEISTCNLAA